MYLVKKRNRINVFDKTIISSYYPDILVLFPEITYELAKEFNATNEKGDTHTGWWEDIYDFNIDVIYPNLEDRITFMEHIIKITKMVPTNIQFSKREEALTKLIFQLADVLYVLMQENIKSMRSKGLDLKHDTKYRFNRIIDTLKKAEIACSRLSRDVGALDDNQVDQFFIDCDKLRELILLISDRIMGNENNYDAIKGCLNLLPSNGLFDNQN